MEGHEFAGVISPEGLVEPAPVLEDRNLLRCGAFGHTTCRQPVEALFSGVATGVMGAVARPPTTTTTTWPPSGVATGRRKSTRPLHREPTLIGAPEGAGQDIEGVIMGEELVLELEHFNGPFRRNGAPGQTLVRQLDIATFMGVQRLVPDCGVAGVELCGVGCAWGSSLGVRSPSKDSTRGVMRGEKRRPDEVLRGAHGQDSFLMPVVATPSGV